MVKTAVIIAIFSSIIASAAAQIVVIDDFSTGAYSKTISNDDPGTSQDQKFQTGNMINGRRLTFFDVESNPFSRPVSLDIGNGFAFAENGAGAVSRVSLGYGFKPTGIPGLIDQDPLNLNFGSLDIDFAANDLPVTVTATAYKSFFNAVQVTKTFSASAGRLSFSAAEFGAPFTASALNFDFRTSTGGDFALSGISAAPVPEPASMAVLGLGLAALKRRRNAKKSI